MYNYKRFMRRIQKTLRNKLLAMLLLIGGILSAVLSDDGTFLVFVLIFAVPMFMTKEDWFYKPED